MKKKTGKTTTSLILHTDNMIFNCLGCGISVSTNKVMCPYCKADNAEAIEMLTGVVKKDDKAQWRERVKGTILSYVLR